MDNLEDFDEFAACCFGCSVSSELLDTQLQVYENPQDPSSEILLCAACAQNQFGESTIHALVFKS